MFIVRNNEGRIDFATADYGELQTHVADFLAEFYQSVEKRTDTKDAAWRVAILGVAQSRIWYAWMCRNQPEKAQRQVLLPLGYTIEIRPEAEIDTKRRVLGMGMFLHLLRSQPQKSAVVTDRSGDRMRFEWREDENGDTRFYADDDLADPFAVAVLFHRLEFVDCDND